MTRTKKIFAGLSIVFLVLLIIASYDISQRTTFPGSKPQLKERLKTLYSNRDSLKTDSIQAAADSSTTRH